LTLHPFQHSLRVVLPLTETLNEDDKSRVHPKVARRAVKGKPYHLFGLCLPSLCHSHHLIGKDYFTQSDKVKLLL
jgi:hypothetical protein